MNISEFKTKNHHNQAMNPPGNVVGLYLELNLRKLPLLGVVYCGVCLCIDRRSVDG